MQRLTPSLLSALFLMMPFAAFSQGVPVASAATASAAQTKAPADSGVRLRTSARIVVLDVVVTDRNQQPVHHLKQSDFAVFEDNTSQTIGRFEEHTYLKTAQPAGKAVEGLPPGVFTNYVAAPANGAVNVLLLDSLNTPLTDQSFVRQQLLQYLQKVPAGTRLAIFGLTTRLTILQGFTSDPAALREVLTKRADKTSPLLDDSVGGGGVQNSLGDDLEDANADAEMVANVRQFDAMRSSFQLQMRAKYTLDAMNQLAHYLAGIPGRKNLVWFSGSFPIDILPDATETIPNPFSVIASSEEEFRDTVDLLSRSQVAVYPIDARGLFNSPMTSVTTTRNYLGRNGAARLNQDLAKFYSDTADEQMTMREIAGQTGGRAFVNTNGLAEAVSSAIEEGSNYYTITYTPNRDAGHGEFRRIKVKLAQQGLNLAYRQGYYAMALDRSTTAADTIQRDTVRNVMMRGAPTPTQIGLAVGVYPFPAIEEKLAAGNVPSPGTHGPYQRYAVNFSVEPANVDFRNTGDGKYHADLKLIIFVFDADGGLVNANETMISMSPTLEQIKASAVKGFVFHQEISVPAKGQYFLRIAVHDPSRDRFGAVEVATSVVKNLKVPGSAAAVPTKGTAPAP